LSRVDSEQTAIWQGLARRERCAVPGGGMQGFSAISAGAIAVIVTAHPRIVAGPEAPAPPPPAGGSADAWGLNDLGSGRNVEPQMPEIRVPQADGRR